MSEEIYEYLINYGFLPGELKKFTKENDKLYFANLKNIISNIEFLEKKGLNKEEVIETIRKNTFMLTTGTKKKELLDEIYKEFFNDTEIKKIIIDYPDMYIINPLVLKEIVNYIKSKKLNPKEVIKNNLNILSADMENIVNII